MSAREEILGRIRAALEGTPEPPEVDRSYRSGYPDGRARGATLDLFVERVADYRAVVERCPAESVEERIAAALDGARAVVPADLPWAVPGATPDTGQSPHELDTYDAVVTAAAVGVALTGTIVLDHGPGQGRRALSLVPDLHVCVVRADQVVGTVPDAVAQLDPRRPQTWVSGPSATSDIELDRVEGVHGPRTLHVLLVD